MSKKHNCLIHGHRFEARYNKEPNSGFQIEETKGTTAALRELRKLCILNIYVRDICVMCGVVVERTSKV